MDVWVFTAARGERTPLTPLVPQLIEVFSYEPSKDDLKRALRDFLDRKLGWDSYEADEADLRNEDLERMLYHWSEREFKVFCKSLRGPEEYKTADGYTFRRQGDGSYTDGDLTFRDVLAVMSQDVLAH